MKTNLDQFYEEYGQKWGNEERKRYEHHASGWKVDIISDMLIKSRLKFNSVLDFGCGPGTVLALLNKKFKIKYMYGIDISSSMINIAKNNFPEGVYYKDKELKNFKQSVDLVLFIDVLEHIKFSERLLIQASVLSKYQLIKVPLEYTLMRNIAKVVGIHKNREIIIWNFPQININLLFFCSNYTLLKLIQVFLKWREHYQIQDIIAEIIKFY